MKTFFTLAFYAVCLIYLSAAEIQTDAKKVIVSGHQRVRACKELGITEIMTEMRSYDSEDKILKDLLETNIRQRGNIGDSSVKLGRRIRELERIYEIREGNSGKVRTDNVGSNFTQQDLAEKLGISVDTLNNAKKLTTLPSEIQDLVGKGKFPFRTSADEILKRSSMSLFF